MSTASDYLSHGSQPEQILPPTSAEDEVRQIEFEWGVAFERRDMAALDRIMADEYILTDPLGGVTGKPRAWPR